MTQLSSQPINPLPPATRKTPSSVASEPLTPQTDSSGAVFQFDAGVFDTLPDLQSLAENVHSHTSSDNPVPSIESDSGIFSSGNYTTSTTANRDAPTFSFSFSPSPRRTGETPTSPTSPSRDRHSEPLKGINQALNEMHLSSPGTNMGMTEIAAALNNIPSGSRARTTLSPDPVALRPGQTTTRRRSSPPLKTVVRHNVQDEAPPRDRFHEPGFQQAIIEAERLIADLTDVLGSSSLHMKPDSTMRRLHEDAAALSHPACPSTRTVGFVGDSGAGKSSLLNSLLDYKGLARTSNSGAACTCVVTEYIYHEKESFDVEVEMFSMDEIMDQLTDLLRSYRHFHHHHDDMDGDEKKDSEESAKVAWDTFQAIFRDRLRSASFLLQQDESEVLEILQSWATELAPSSLRGCEQVASASACSDLLTKLTSEQGSPDEPAMWPYIRKIKVFLKAHILANGLILVDLPGLRDLNAARRNITERYLLHCDEIFAVCIIGRATTDAGVMSVFDLAQQAHLSNVGIVCTKSDDIRVEEAKNDWRGELARKIQRLIDVVDTDRRDLESITTELNDFDDVDDLLDEERDEQLRLYHRSRAAKKRLAEHEFQLTKFLVSTRNERVTESLERLYGPKLPGHSVKVFCVSNVQYWDYRFAPIDEALPHLELSGILAVRKHCLSIVAEAQLQIATKYIRADIPALLEDVNLWVQSGAGTMDAEQKATVRRTLDMLESRMKRALLGRTSEINDVSRTMRAEFKDEILSQSTQRSAAWSRGARNASIDWSGWHHTTYAAFCRNYGNHCTAAAGARNWNEEAIEAMTEDLLPQWEVLLRGIDSHQEDITTLIEESLDSAVEDLAELGDESPYTTTLQQALLSRQRLLLANVEGVYDGFNSDLSTLGTDALSGIRTSMIGQALEDSYNTCRLDGGRGVDARRKGLMGRKLGDVALFHDLMTEARKRFKELANTLQTNLQAAVQTHLAVVQNTLDLIRDENVALESESDDDFRLRVEGTLQGLKDRLRLILARLPSA